MVDVSSTACALNFGTSTYDVYGCLSIDSLNDAHTVISSSSIILPPSDNSAYDRCNTTPCDSTSMCGSNIGGVPSRCLTYVTTPLNENTSPTCASRVPNQFDESRMVWYVFCAGNVHINICTLVKPAGRKCQQRADNKRNTHTNNASGPRHMLESQKSDI